MKYIEVCIDWSRGMLNIGERSTDYAYEKIRAASTSVIGTCTTGDPEALHELRKKCMRKALHKMNKQLSRASKKVDSLTAEVTALTAQLEEISKHENE